MPEDKSKESLRFKLNQYLEKHKHRKTPERDFVVDVVSESSKRFDAEYIYNEVLNKKIQISKATVYNTLDLLVKAQLIREHTIDAKRYYEKANLSQMFVRLVCTKCGKVKDVKDNDLISSINNRKFGRFSTMYSSVMVYGLCSSCVNAQRKASLKEKLIAKEIKLENKKKLIINSKKR